MRSRGGGKSAMRDNRLSRFCEWLRDAPILAGLWLLDRIAGPYPETEADRIGEREKDRRGCRIIVEGPFSRHRSVLSCKTPWNSHPCK